MFQKKEKATGLLMLIMGAILLLWPGMTVLSARSSAYSACRAAVLRRYPWTADAPRQALSDIPTEALTSWTDPHNPMRSRRDGS